MAPFRCFTSNGSIRSLYIYFQNFLAGEKWGMACNSVSSGGPTAYDTNWNVPGVQFLSRSHVVVCESMWILTLIYGECELALGRKDKLGMWV